MASAPISDLVDHFKLETQICQHYTLEMTRTLNRDRGRRAAKTEKKWTKRRDLGYGAFGEVWLEENQFGETRAVKGVKKNRNIGVDYYKELLAMANLSKV
jgi:hypothetical protein